VKSIPKRAPELRLPYPLVEYLLTLPGDWVKVILRLLQRAQWTPGVAPSGDLLDAGEIIISFRSSALWDAVALYRALAEDGRTSLVRRVLARLTRDGYIDTRKTSAPNTTGDTPTNTHRNTRATIVRFLRFRDNLWPGNADATRPEFGRERRSDPILAVDPANPDPCASTSRPQTLKAVPPLLPDSETCAVWQEVSEGLKGEIRPDLHGRWIAPLTATLSGDELLLRAPNRFHQAFIEDNLRALLEERVASASQGSIRVRFAAALVA
jgi:hypothetical protein